MKHLLNPLDLSVEETDRLLNLADSIAADPPGTVTAVQAKN